MKCYIIWIFGEPKDPSSAAPPGSGTFRFSGKPYLSSSSGLLTLSCFAISFPSRPKSTASKTTPSQPQVPAAQISSSKTPPRQSPRLFLQCTSCCFHRLSDWTDRRTRLLRLRHHRQITDKIDFRCRQTLTVASKYSCTAWWLSYSFQLAHPTHPIQLPKVWVSIFPTNPLQCFPACILLPPAWTTTSARERTAYRWRIHGCPHHPRQCTWGAGTKSSPCAFQSWLLTLCWWQSSWSTPSSTESSWRSVLLLRSWKFWR